MAHKVAPMLKQMALTDNVAPQIFSRGYQLIRKVPGEHYLDASQLLENLPDAYIAAAHLSKVGNAALGKFFNSAVKKVLNQPAS